MSCKSTQIARLFHGFQAGGRGGSGACSGCRSAALAGLKGEDRRTLLDGLATLLEQRGSGLKGKLPRLRGPAVDSGLLEVCWVSWPRLSRLVETPENLCSVNRTKISLQPFPGVSGGAVGGGSSGLLRVVDLRSSSLEPCIAASCWTGWPRCWIERERRKLLDGLATLLAQPGSGPKGKVAQKTARAGGGSGVVGGFAGPAGGAV